MPRPAKAGRIRITARLPFDVYREAARRATDKGWSMSDFIAYAVANEITYTRRQERKPHVNTYIGTSTTETVRMSVRSDDE